ncbi:MAG: DMT family transporter [Alphaproteobacteria bacterium]
MNNWVLYAATVLIWGASWYGIKLQLGVVEPAVSVMYRFAAASLILMAWCLLRGVRLRFSARQHGFAALMGLLMFCLNYVVFYVASADVTTAFVALSISLTVILNSLFGSWFLGRPMRPVVVVGGLAGVAGIALVFWSELAGLGGGQATVRGIVLCLIGTVSVSLGNTVSARNQQAGMAVLPTNAVAMAYSALFVALYIAATGKPVTFDVSPVYMGALAYLVVFATVIAFGCFLTLLGRIGADRAAYAMVLQPVVALVISTAVEGFRWGWPAALGVALVLAGNAIVLGGARTTATARQAL